MKILLVCHEHPPLGGGAGNAAAQMARQLAAMGHELVFISSALRGRAGREETGGYRLQRVEIGRKSDAGCDIPELVHFAFAGHTAAVSAARSLSPDLVLAYFTLPEGLIARRLHRSLNLPYAVYLRGGDVPGFMKEELGFYQSLAKPLIRRIWGDARHVIANSEYLARLAGRTSSRAVPVVPNGYYTEDFYPDESRRPAGHVQLLFSGRLVHQKGVETLLAALSLLREKNLRLDIVGSGPLEGALKKTAVELRIDDRVTFNGWVAREKILSFYQKAHALVLPSRDEGMPNVITEASACGAAVIGSTAGGIPEVVREGFNGFLVPPDDPRALAAAIGRLTGDPTGLKRLGDNSFTLSRSRTWAHSAQMLLALLESKG
ncbi:MAG: glycosyltransferase [Endomicrobiales bacterium]